MKNRLVSGIVLVIVALLLSACGIPQEAYDTVVTEREDAQDELASLKTKLTVAENELADKESEFATVESKLTAVESELALTKTELAAKKDELSTAQSRTATLQSQLSSAQSESSTLTQKIAEMRLYGEILSKYYFEFVEERTMTTEESIGLTGLVNDVGDAQLSEIFQTWFESTTDAEEFENRMVFYQTVWDGLWGILQ